MLKNTTYNYGAIAKFFHWSAAILIILILILGFTVSLTDDKPLRIFIITIHKSLGVTLLILMVLRLLWRIFNHKPVLPFTVKTWEKVAAYVSELLLYLTVFATLIVGLIITGTANRPIQFWWLFNIHVPIAPNKALNHFAGTLHLILAWTIIALVFIHVSAALKHHFYDKDIVLRRMLPSRRHSR